MLTVILWVIGAFIAGFACGRVKNRAKLAAVQSEADKLRASAEAQLKKL